MKKFNREKAHENFKKAFIAAGKSEDEAEEECKKAFGASEDDDEEGEKDEAEEARKALEAAVDDINKGKFLISQEELDAKVREGVDAQSDEVMKSLTSMATSVNLCLEGVRDRLGNMEKAIVAGSVLEAKRDEMVKSLTSTLDEMKKSLGDTVDEMKKGLPLDGAPINQPAIETSKVVPIGSPLDGAPGDEQVAITHEMLSGTAKDMLKKGGLGERDVDQLHSALKMVGDMWNPAVILDKSPILKAEIDKKRTAGK